MLSHGCIMKLFMSLIIMCCVKTWQKSKLPHFSLYIWIITLCTLSLHSLKKSFHNQSQKSLEEYLSSPFRCIYSIYIHSWAHVWHPFRKVFLPIVWKECSTEITHSLHTVSRSGAVYRTLKRFVNHCSFQQIKHFQSNSTPIHTNIPLFRPFQNWTVSSSWHRKPSPDSGVSCVSHDLVQFSWDAEWHTLKQSIQVCVIRRKKAKWSLFPYSARQRHLILWQEIWYVSGQGQITGVFKWSMNML